ncbi:MAG TPA: hypothetical protein VNU95_12395 [Candidatus Acidoferrales bacterium]|nr:hypothetical protein [Candidatus Acidoferrales bacterium]
MDIVDLLVIVAVVAILAAMVIPMLAAGKRRASGAFCLNNLKIDSISLRVWEGDNNNQYPMSYITNGVLEWPLTTNIAVYFRAMSNQLNSPKFLICPADREHVPATNWTTDFNNSRISYFINPDASEAYPQEIMSGDDNLAVSGVPVKSGLLLLSGNAPVSWTTERHGRVGNLSFADGSVAEESSLGLQNALESSREGTPITTNRIAIP